MDFLTEEKIKLGLKIALDRLIQRDKYLIEHNVNERSITHKLAEYLQVYFENMDVDCEYNRDGDLPKILDLPSVKNKKVSMSDTQARTVFPDVIVHRRGKNSENILVIEAKKQSNRSGVEFDESKLAAYKNQYGYLYAALVLFSVEYGYTIKWI